MLKPTLFGNLRKSSRNVTKLEATDEPLKFLYNLGFPCFSEFHSFIPLISKLFLNIVIVII